MIICLKNGRFGSNIKIRNGLWETNSSSVHSLIIRKEKPTNLPHKVYFGLGEYGWEQRCYNDTDTKCRYLNTAMYDRYVCYLDDKTKYYQYQKRIKEILKANGVESEWFDIERISKDDRYDYYIDHANELDDFLEYMLFDELNYLVDWLFNEDSLLITDNDNSEMELTEEAREKYDNNKDYEVFTKGN